MALDIYGPTRFAKITDEGEPIVAQLPAALGIHAPLCSRIWTNFYEGPNLNSPAEVLQWRAELIELRTAWSKRRRTELMGEKRVLAKTRADVNRKIDAILAKEPISRAFIELVAVCDDALAGGTGLRCMSD